MEYRRLTARMSYEGEHETIDSQSVLTRFAPARLRFTRFSGGHENRDDGRVPERSITILCLVYGVDFFVDASHPNL